MASKSATQGPSSAPALRLTITEEDLRREFPAASGAAPNRVRALPVALGAGEAVVGYDGPEAPTAPPPPVPTPEQVAAVLPKVIGRKVQQLVPEGFQLAEMSFSVELAFQFAGLGPSATVEVTFARKDA